LLALTFVPARRVLSSGAQRLPPRRDPVILRGTTRSIAPEPRRVQAATLASALPVSPGDVRIATRPPEVGRIALRAVGAVFQMPAPRISRVVRLGERSGRRILSATSFRFWQARWIWASHRGDVSPYVLSTIVAVVLGWLVATH
jgi:hypothetical protein